MKMNIFDELIDAILTLDSSSVLETVEKALAMGVDPLEIIEKGLTKGIRIVGERFERGEIFICELVMAAEAMKTGTERLKPEILKAKKKRKTLGRVVIGTVSGDVHDIGKNIVAAMLYAAGFDVYDLGVDVPAETFIETAERLVADIIAVSALLTSTLPYQRELIEALSSKGVRHKFKVIIGGAPANEEWAREIGADGYGSDAIDAVRQAKSVLGVE